MNLTRENLISLIVEEINNQRNVLLEEAPVPDPGQRSPAGPEDRYLTDDEGREKVDLAKQTLFHMAAQAQQLHDIVVDGDRINPSVLSSIIDAAGDLEEAFKAITYDKQNPGGR